MIGKIIGCAAGLFLAAALSAEVAYETDFRGEGRQGWTLPAGTAWVEEAGRAALEAAVPDDRQTKGRVTAELPFDLSSYRGCPMRLTVQCRAEKVSRPPEEWNGIKFMLHYKKDGRPVWRSPSGLYGSFDWKVLEISFVVPEGVEGGKLMLGLENSSGRVWFRDLKIEVEKIETLFPVPELPDGFRAAYSERVRRQPPLRGTMSPARYRAEDLDELASWGANVIRWQLVRNWGKQNSDRELEEYRRWIDSKIEELDRVLEHAERVGLKVIIDLHSPPGGRSPEVMLFHRKPYLDLFIETWRKIAGRFRGRRALWGYDLLNEPMQSQPARVDYLTAQRLAAEAIREIDPETPIIIESNDWCSAPAFRYLAPLPLKNIIYQVHMYWPGGYTHQQVGNTWGVDSREKLTAYPDRTYHREALKNYLQPVRDFQLKYGARIYVGEFSAVRWAPGADRYLEDCISIFEEYGWDWSYHAFREWSGWSVEHSEDPRVTGRVDGETARKKVLLKYFKRNTRP